MNKYLIAILKEVNTIIIPDLGALTIVNHATGEIMFMPYLKFDDGKLSKHIAEREGWEENEAKNLIAKYVREVRTKLDQGETYDIYQVGSFFKNEEGDVDFRIWSGEQNQTVPTSPVVESSEPERAAPSVTTEEPVSEQLEPTAEKMPEEITPAEEPIIPESTPQPAEAEKQEEKAPVDEVASAEISHVHEQKDDELTPVSEEEQWKDDLDVPPVNFQKETPKKPILEKAVKDKKPKKRGAGFYILLGFLVVLIGGGTYFGINYNELKQHISFLADKEEATPEKEESVDKEAADAELTAQDDAPENNEFEETTDEVPAEETETATEETAPVEPEIRTNAGIRVDKALPVQVIAGSFTEESNANGMVERLKAAGHDAAIIGQYDQLYLVSVGSFESMEAFGTQKSSVAAIAPKYWVFRK